MATVMRASPAQRSRVGIEEGNRLKAYRDTLGIWTIAKGHAATNPIPVRGMLNGKFYEGPPKEGVTITPEEVERLFSLDMDETERGISALVTAELTQNQFDALVDFAHQYGMGKFEGSTLIEKINFNPNSPAVLEQFMRWTQAGGEHQEYVWRRSARRCCIYTGALIPQKLWRKASTEKEKTDGYPFAIKYDDGWKIDYSVTPTIEQILADARRLSKPPESVVSKSWNDIVGAHPEPSITIITDTPAAPPQADANAGQPESKPPAPAPAAPAPDLKPAAPVPKSPSAAGPAAGGSNVPPPVSPKVAEKPKEPPPVVAGEGGTKPPHPQTKMPEGVPYGVDLKAGAKPMEATERFVGSAMMWVANGLRVGAANGMKVTGFLGFLVTLFLDMMKSPVTAALVLSTIVAAVLFVVWLFGVIVEKAGLKKKKAGEVKASQLMY